MSDQRREFDDDAYSEQFKVDILPETDDTDGTESKTQDVEDKYKTLRAEMDALKEQNSQLLSKITDRPAYQAPREEPKARQGIDEQALMELGKNPKALVEYVNNSIQSGLSTVNNAQLRNQFESKLNEEFPALKTNKKFEEATISQIRELVATGEYTADNPRLVYRAAQLAAAKMGDMKKTEQPNRETSLGVSNTRGVTRGSSTTIKDNDPRLAFAVQAGMTDPKELAKFKKTLEQDYGSTEEHWANRGKLKPRGRRIGRR